MKITKSQKDLVSSMKLKISRIQRQLRTLGTVRIKEDSVGLLKALDYSLGDITYDLDEALECNQEL